MNTATVAPSSLNYTTTNTYDNLDRLQTSTDAKQGQSSFTYDGQDRNLTATDPRHLQTQTPRNGLGSVSKLISPDTGSTNYTYDAAGNVTSRTDSRGVRAGYSWDALNRLHYIYYSGGGFTNSETYNWDYDQVASGITNGIGRLTGLDYPAGNARYGYDPQGHMVYEQYQVLAQSGINARIWKPISYGYDGAVHVTSITYPSGRVISYSYSGGLLSTIALKTSANASTATNLLSNIHWQPFGAADSWNWQMASGPQAYSRVYDGYGRIVRYPLGNLVRDLTYDDGDRIKSYTHYDATTAQAQPSYDQSFGYDELGRLKTITTNVNTWGIQYDANGNRSGFTLNGTAQTYNIDAASNKLLNIDQSRSFNYDNAGNTKTDSTSYTATYGITGMLASISKGGITTSYSYNNNGQRIRKTDGTTAGTTVYVYDFNTGNLLGEYDSNGNPIKEYVWMGDTPVAVITPDPVNSANPPLVYYVYSDHLNTPRVIVDQGNNIRWRWLAEPFGNTAPESNPSNLGNFTFNLRFPGQYADQESGLFYNINRYYDPSLGRYQQSDPIGLAGGQFSTYQYVGSNPLGYVDPNGQFSVSPQVIETALARAGLAEVGGLGPENPLADAAALVAFGATVVLSSDTPQPAAPVPAPKPQLSDRDLQRAVESSANYWEYKRACDDVSDINFERTLEQAEAGWEKPNRCEVAKRLRDRIKLCKALRAANTDKWHGGVDDKHNPQLHDDIERRLQNAESLVNRYCKDDCK